MGGSVRRTAQTIQHDPDNGNIGNCFAACLASILEVDIQEVPEMPAWNDGWFKSYEKYLTEKGYHWLWMELDNCYVPGYSVVSGPGPRGVLHSCVAFNGDIVWDPHPSQEGVVKVVDTFMLLPLVDGPGEAWLLTRGHP